MLLFEFKKEDAGVAVLKSLELDELLGGGTTQYREVCVFIVFQKLKQKLQIAFFHHALQ